MSIVVKRARKYFLPKDISPQVVNEERVSNDALLHTIKIGKNIFKLSLPESAYDPVSNYATAPQPTIKNKSSLKRDQSTDGLEVNNVQNLPKIVRIISDDETLDEGVKRRNVKIKVTNITSTIADTEVNVNEMSL